MKSKKANLTSRKNRLSGISFSDPETIKDLPNNPDVKVEKRKILFGEFRKKINVRLQKWVHSV